MMRYLCVLLWLWSGLAVAQERSIVVVLDVPNELTGALVSGLEAEGIHVEGQPWFLAQVQSLGIAPRRVIRRPEDMRLIMDTAQIRGVVFVEPQEDEGFTANLLGVDGEPEARLALERFDESSVPRVVSMVSGRLARAPVVVEPLPEEPAEPVERVEERPVSSPGWLRMGLGGRLLKRDLVVGGKNGGVLTYPSQLYPGGQLVLEGHPSGEGVGFQVQATGGLGSVGTALGPESILHLDLEAALAWRVLFGGAELTLRGGGRYTGFSTDATVLPSTSFVAAGIGAGILAPLSDVFAMRADVQVTPFGVLLSGKDSFGESSFTYGFGALLGFRYGISASLALDLDYRFRVDRTAYTGQGGLGFQDAEAFEQVQGLHLGLNLAL